MQADLRPGHGFQQLVERAVAAGQHQDRVREFVHAGLALVHVGHQFERGEAGVRDLAAVERFGEHADDFGALDEGRVGQHAH